MSETILLSTLALEIGLAAGYALAWRDRFIREGRAMVMGMLEALFRTRRDAA